MSDLMAAYRQQEGRARQRGINWEFTFESWLAVWRDSGKLHLRGRGKGNYVMARNGDVGPYSPENVSICTVSQNFKDAYKNGRGGGNCNLGKGRGWTYVARNHLNPYQVTCQHRYIGSFRTQEEAERAYAEAIKKFSPFEPLNATQQICAAP